MCATRSGFPWHELRRELLRIAGLLVKGHPGAQTILLPLSCPSEPRSTPQASNATGQRALRPGATRKLFSTQLAVESNLLWVGDSAIDGLSFRYWLVGSVKDPGKSLNLWFVPREGDGTLRRGYLLPYELVHVTLQDDFHDDIRAQLTAEVVSGAGFRLSASASVVVSGLDGITPPGWPLSLSAWVGNDGDAASAATTLRYYLSTDGTITTSDTSVGTVAVGALAAGATSSSPRVDFNAPSSAGTYYYGACVDAVTGESDTTNNCSGSIAVEVTE